MSVPLAFLCLLSDTLLCCVRANGLTGHGSYLGTFVNVWPDGTWTVLGTCVNVWPDGTWTVLMQLRQSRAIRWVTPD